MKRLLLPLLAAIALPNAVNADDLVFAIVTSTIKINKTKGFYIVIKELGRN